MRQSISVLFFEKPVTGLLFFGAINAIHHVKNTGQAVCTALFFFM
jgi:hypothetical protein